MFCECFILSMKRDFILPISMNNISYLYDGPCPGDHLVLPGHVPLGRELGGAGCRDRSRQCPHLKENCGKFEKRFTHQKSLPLGEMICSVNKFSVLTPSRCILLKNVVKVMVRNR